MLPCISMPMSLFQSSPALSGRCNMQPPFFYIGGDNVSILTGPFGPVQRRLGRSCPAGVDVSILTGPFGPVQRSYNSGFSGNGKVSILTGPFGPVQPGHRALRRLPGRVSILTGPFGPVQLSPTPWRMPGREFQSSPALSGRCNAILEELRGGPMTFQSSPALSGRCNTASYAALQSTVCFNPHRPFRAGATRMEL